MSGWQSQALNLASSEFERKPEPPQYLGLIYRGRRHMLSGPPESLKTLVAALAALEAIRGGENVAYIDFENGPYGFRQILADVGASKTEIENGLIYLPAENPPDAADITWLLDEEVTLVVIDSGAGAYNISSLDDGKRGDVEAFAQLWIDPLWRAEITSIVLDHVVKNQDSRGKWAIGSERKSGSVDVHLGLDVPEGKQLTRGGEGVVKVNVGKDRPGFHTRPTTAVITLTSDPYTHAITYELRSADEAEVALRQMPTWYMEQVSRYVEDIGEAGSRNQIADAIGRKRTKVLEAIRCLLSLGYLDERRVAGGGSPIRSIKAFRDGDELPGGSQFPGGSHRFPGTSDSTGGSLVPPGSPPTGERGTGNRPVKAAEEQFLRPLVPSPPNGRSDAPPLDHGEAERAARFDASFPPKGAS